jgi:hypothetical protein
MEHSTAEVPLSAWAELLRLLLVFAIPAAAVLVARHRSSWLLRAWLATWLVFAAITLISNRSAPERAPLAVEIVAVSGVATALPVLWLHLGRRHPIFSRLPVQLLGAVAAFFVGAVAALVIMDAIWGAA